MIEESKIYYTCEYCGRVFLDYDNAKQCEEECKQIQPLLKELLQCCQKLNENGCHIKLRDYPFYESNTLDEKAFTMIRRSWKDDGLELISQYQEPTQLFTTIPMHSDTYCTEISTEGVK